MSGRGAPSRGEYPMVEYLLFDVDNTLYPTSSGLLQQVDARINRYMAEKAGVAAEAVDAEREAYRGRFGTTLKGLMVEYGIDPEEYLQYVHDVPVEQLIEPNVKLDQALGQIPAAKAVFTNGPIEYSSRILQALGVSRHFSHFFDVRFLGFRGKPSPAAYEMVLGTLGAAPDACALVEDSLRNLRPAKSLGMRTVLVGDNSADWVDACISEISQINEVGFLRQRAD